MADDVPQPGKHNGALGRCDHMAAWRAAHAVAVDAGLPSKMVAELRRWVGNRMRSTPAAVFHLPGGEFRDSFVKAMEHAADTIAHGGVPD